MSMRAVSRTKNISHVSVQFTLVQSMSGVSNISPGAHNYPGKSSNMAIVLVFPINIYTSPLTRHLITELNKVAFPTIDHINVIFVFHFCLEIKTFYELMKTSYSVIKDGSYHEKA